VVLRNYEGYITTYEEPLQYEQHDKSRCTYCQNPRDEIGQSGVHGLLQGERMWIEPRGFQEVHMRGNTEAHRLQDPSKWVPYGVGAIEGQVARTLPVLGPTTIGASDTNAGIVEPQTLIPEEQRDEVAAYGPGEEPRPPEGAPTGSAHGELL
jgi:hypothetical protein